MIISKADTSTQLSEQEAYNASVWVNPPFDMRGLKKMVVESSILPQCIRAYKSNIAGFGVKIRYATDDEVTPEMEAEYNAASEVLELLNVEHGTKKVFEDAIEARETYGCGYIEVIRNVEGEVVQIEFLRNTESIAKTEPLEPYEDYVYYHHGLETVRKKKFRKYKQVVGGKTVYFKEFGDPRLMKVSTGDYVEDELPVNERANEILELPIGTMPYGEIRWIGQILGIDGSRRAESLNNNYFVNGRHTPLIITVEGGTLTDDAYDKLNEYMEGIKGEEGQHAFLVLEVENAEQRTGFEQDDKPHIEIKDMASILQKDELFQEYLDNNRKRVQSAFLLPDLYVGYTTDFNRATAQMAMEVTEKQVFQPERESLEHIVNNRLLNCYKFRYVEVYFEKPDLTNPDDIYKIMTVVNNAGGLDPNKAKDILYRLLGENSEDYPDEWGNIPLAIQQKSQSVDAAMGNLMTQVAGQIQKAEKKNESEEVIAVMKQVYAVLAEMKQEAS